MIARAVAVSTEAANSGPVHINIPLRDPIYADVTAPFQHIAPSKPFLLHHPSPPPVSETEVEQWIHHTNPKQPRILIVVGMHHPQPELSLALQSLQTKLPILTDVVSQQQANGLAHWDRAFPARSAPRRSANARYPYYPGHGRGLQTIETLAKIT